MVGWMVGLVVGQPEKSRLVHDVGRTMRYVGLGRVGLGKVIRFMGLGGPYGTSMLSPLLAEEGFVS